MEGAKHINSGKGADEVFLECGNGALGGICSIVVRGDKLDIDCFRSDVLRDPSGTFVVHYVQCQMVAAGFQYGDDLVNACTMEASVHVGMARMMITLRL